MNDLKRYKNALEEIERLDPRAVTEYGMIAREALHPAPQYENVEAKVWAEVFKITGKVLRTCGDGDKPQTVKPNCVIVALTGTFPREIKPKVMRRQELPRDSFRAGYQGMSPDTKFYAEWEE